MNWKIMGAHQIRRTTASTQRKNSGSQVNWWQSYQELTTEQGGDNNRVDNIDNNNNNNVNSNMKMWRGHLVVVTVPVGVGGRHRTPG